MTGAYPSFMATQDGRAILGHQPTLSDMLSSLAQGAPTGGYGGAPRGLGSPGAGSAFISGGGVSPIFGAGDLARGGGAAPPAGGGGGRGVALPPGTQGPLNPVPGQGVSTGAGGGAGPAPSGINITPTMVAQIEHLLRGGGGGGGAGGAGGTAPGGIGAGESAAASADRFAQSNAAVTPSIRNAMQMAGLVMSPMTAPQQLLGDYLGSLMGFGSGFTIGGQQLAPAQLQQVSQAYQTYGPAYAQRLLASMRNQAMQSTAGSVPGLMSATGGYGGSNFAAPGFGITRTGSTPLSANQVAAELATYGGPRFAGGAGMGGGGAGMGGGGPDTGGGFGGGPGNMGGGQNRQD